MNQANNPNTHHGLSALVRSVEVLEAIQTAYQGAVVAQIYEGNKVFDVALVLAPAERYMG